MLFRFKRLDNFDQICHRTAVVARANEEFAIVLVVVAGRIIVLLQKLIVILKLEVHLSLGVNKVLLNLEDGKGILVLDIRKVGRGIWPLGLGAIDYELFQLLHRVNCAAVFVADSAIERILVNVGHAVGVGTDKAKDLCAPNARLDGLRLGFGKLCSKLLHSVRFVEAAGATTDIFKYCQQAFVCGDKRNQN